MHEELNSFCLVCGGPRGSRPKYCSKKCSTKAYQRVRPVKDIHEYYSRTPRNFFQSLIQKKNKDRSRISLDFLESLWKRQRGLCAISGVPMTHIRGSGKVPTNVSIDRIDSSEGYVEGNIQLVCYRVNVLKMEYDVDDLIWWASQIINNNVKNNSSSNLKLESKSKNRSYPRDKKARRK